MAHAPVERMFHRKICMTKHLSGIFERTTVRLDCVNAFIGTKSVTKANFLSIFNLLLQRVGGTKALHREKKKVAAFLTKDIFFILRSA